MAGTTLLSELGDSAVRTMIALAMVVALVAMLCGAPRADADAGTAGSPLELVSVRLTQEGSRMRLYVLTAQPWVAAELSADGSRQLCVDLSQRSPELVAGRVCVGHRGGRAVLTYARVGPGAQAGPTRVLAAKVERTSPRSLNAVFLPASVGLAEGAFSWLAQSTWTDLNACATPCVDAHPAEGRHEGTMRLYAGRWCFGAASRDLVRRCNDPRLRRSVALDGQTVAAVPIPLCDRRQHVGLLSICTFGAPAEFAEGEFAIVGDSHAAHWKPAFEQVAQKLRWRGHSVFRAGCPPTSATAVLTTATKSQQCRTWSRDVRAWLRRHPEIGTVFLSARAGTQIVGGSRASQLAYRRELQALLTGSRLAIVVRDTPVGSASTVDCVAQAIDARADLTSACATPRSTALAPDPLAAAANELGGNAHVIDLSSYFCDANVCPAVIGGALVRRDTTHLSPTYAATLGPYLVRALERILP